MKKGLLLLLTLGLMPACYPKAGPPPDKLDEAAVQKATARWPGTTSESLEQGRQLFIDNCGACHDLPDLQAFPASDWPSTARRMSKDKAKLGAADTDLLVRYVEAATQS